MPSQLHMIANIVMVAGIILITVAFILLFRNKAISRRRPLLLIGIACYAVGMLIAGPTAT